MTMTGVSTILAEDTISQICELSVPFKSFVVVLIGQRTQSIIGRLVFCLLSSDVFGYQDCKTWLVIFDLPFFDKCPLVYCQ